MANFCDKFIIFTILLSLSNTKGAAVENSKSAVNTVNERNCVQWLYASVDEADTIDTKRNPSVSLITVALLTTENAGDYLDPVLSSELQQVHKFPGDVPYFRKPENNIQYVGIQCLSAYPVTLKHDSPIEKDGAILRIVHDPEPKVVPSDGPLELGFQDSIILEVNVSARPSSLHIICTQDNKDGILPEYGTGLLITVDSVRHLSGTRLYFKSKMDTVIDGFYPEAASQSGTLQVCLPMLPLINTQDDGLHKSFVPSKRPPCAPTDNFSYAKEIPVKGIITVVSIIAAAYIILWIISPALKKANMDAAARLNQRYLRYYETFNESLATFGSGSDVWPTARV